MIATDIPKPAPTATGTTPIQPLTLDLAARAVFRQLSIVAGIASAIGAPGEYDSLELRELVRRHETQSARLKQVLDETWDQIVPAPDDPTLPPWLTAMIEDINTQRAAQAAPVRWAAQVLRLLDALQEFEAVRGELLTQAAA
jgi:hypothetical protein